MQVNSGLESKGQGGMGITQHEKAGGRKYIFAPPSSKLAIVWLTFLIHSQGFRGLYYNIVFLFEAIILIVIVKFLSINY